MFLGRNSAEQSFIASAQIVFQTRAAFEKKVGGKRLFSMMASCTSQGFEAAFCMGCLSSGDNCGFEGRGLRELCFVVSAVMVMATCQSSSKHFCCLVFHNKISCLLSYTLYFFNLILIDKTPDIGAVFQSRPCQCLVEEESDTL